MDKIAYKIPRPKGRKGEVLILVERPDGEGNIPRNAGAIEIKECARKIGRELESVTAMAETIVDFLKKLDLGKIEIEFGIELGAAAGIPLLTSAGAKANFKVTLGWEAASSETAKKGGK